MVTWKDPQRFQCEMSRVLKTQSHVKIYTPPNSTSTNQMSPWGISSVLPTIHSNTFQKISNFCVIVRFSLSNQIWSTRYSIFAIFDQNLSSLENKIVGNTEYHRNWLTFRYDADADHIIMPELEQRRMMMGSIWEWPPYFEIHFKHGFLHFSWKWIA